MSFPTSPLPSFIVKVNSEDLLATGNKDRMEEAARRLEKALGIYPKVLEAQLG